MTSNKSKKTKATAIITSHLSWFVSGYDIILLLTLVPIASELFFPHINSNMSILAVFVVISLSLLARFFGGIIFAQFGDKEQRNRLKIIIFSVSGLSLIMLVTPAIPLVHEIDSPLLSILFLILSRIGIGIFVGGIWSAAMVHAMESVTKKEDQIQNHGFFSSLVQVGFHIGLTVGFVIFFFGFGMPDTIGDAIQVWDNMHYIGAGFGVISLIITLVAYKKFQPSEESEQDEKIISKPINYILKNEFHTRPLYSLALIVIGLMYVYYSTIAVMKEYLNLDIFHVPELANFYIPNELSDSLIFVIFAILSLWGHLFIGILQSKARKKTSKFFRAIIYKIKKIVENDSENKTQSKKEQALSNKNNAFTTNSDVLLISSFCIITIILFILIIFVGTIPNLNEQGWPIFILLSFLMIFATGAFGLLPSLLSSMFRKQIRNTGASLTYNSSMFLSFSSPFITMGILLLLDTDISIPLIAFLGIIGTIVAIYGCARIVKDNSRGYNLKNNLKSNF